MNFYKQRRAEAGEAGEYIRTKTAGISSSVVCLKTRFKLVVNHARPPPAREAHDGHAGCKRRTPRAEQSPSYICTYIGVKV